MSCVLTVDIGTTSSKAHLVLSTGEVILAAQEFYPTHFPSRGRAEQDPMEIAHAVDKIIHQCASQSPQKIRAICFSSAMHTLLAVAESHTPITPVIIWSDSRSEVQAREMKSSALGDLIYSRTGTPIHPMSPFCKLLWMRKNARDVFTRAARFISIKEFIIHRLTGRYAVDYSVASASGLFDVHDLRWSSDALQHLGLTENRLSTCVSPYHQVGAVFSSVAGDLALPPDVVVVAGASDGCLANVGSDAMNPGDVSLTIGTSGAVRTAAHTYHHDPGKRVFNYRLDESTFIMGGATNNGTILLNWFSGNFLQNSAMEIAEFVELASASPPGGEGLVFLPYVFGERAPHHTPDFKGVFFGLAQHHQHRHLMRSLLEGICFEMRSIVDSVEEASVPVKKVFASGGFIRSGTWVQLLADILNRKIWIRDVHDASSLGAARVAFKSLGVEAVFRPQSDEQSFTPNPATRKLYDDLYGIFCRTTEALKPEFEALSKVV